MAGSDFSSSGWAMLPPELLEMQLGQIDLLMAMYPSPEELVVSDDTRAVIERARQVCEEGGMEGAQIPATLEVFLDIRLELVPADEAAAAADSPAAGETVEVEVAIPLGYDQGTAAPPSGEPPRIRTRMRQPPWASRAEAARVNDETPQDEDVLGIIEYIREAATRAYTQSLASSATSGLTSGSGGSGDGSASTSSQEIGSSRSYSPTTKDAEPLVRVWFYFPSISTRAKRDDLVRNAPAYGLTGFLLAGKPGLLCLEGGSRAVDEYMRFIKTESWGDIPAHHKKVSERYREESSGGGGGDTEKGSGGKAVTRVFGDMVEITDTVGGERRGERANRGDMKAIEAWLTERGLGEAFTKVLI
ncbi:hypothetical protein Micbo1qcDRAFT_207936 [Microdochium bolleyi]|uniref:Small nuclear ribonucleoprotein Prp3 C-terminal domain-containing protein n=1 Tax=Microdochium bolleyi TaxID=196109 RepID=A0A136IS72_9PEZI|nr:hypothetical protein Micbo1qcDRAFT_207936 [Microdochium bolleyi]